MKEKSAEKEGESRGSEERTTGGGGTRERLCRRRVCGRQRMRKRKDGVWMELGLGSKRRMSIEDRPWKWWRPWLWRAVALRSGEGGAGGGGDGHDRPWFNLRGSWAPNREGDLDFGSASSRRDLEPCPQGREIGPGCDGNNR